MWSGGQVGWSGLQARRPRGPLGQATWKAALKEPEDLGGGDGREGAEGSGVVTRMDTQPSRVCL